MSDLHAGLAGPAGTEGISCARCAGNVEREETRTVQKQRVCTRCAEKVLADLAAERDVAPRLPFALAGGFVGASVAAAIWTAIAVFARYEVGIVAVLVGFLAGQGVRLGAGKARGRPLQAAAAALATLGLLQAKYFTFAHFAAEALLEEGVGAGPFDPAIVAAFPRALPEMLSGFDLLWVALALSAAWKVPAASGLRVDG